MCVCACTHTRGYVHGCVHTCTQSFALGTASSPADSMLLLQPGQVSRSMAAKAYDLQLRALFPDSCGELGLMVLFVPGCGVARASPHARVCIESSGCVGKEASPPVLTFCILDRVHGSDF